MPDGENDVRLLGQAQIGVVMERLCGGGSGGAGAGCAAAAAAADRSANGRPRLLQLIINALKERGTMTEPPPSVEYSSQCTQVRATRCHRACIAASAATIGGG